MSIFKDKFEFSKRKSESSRILEKYSDRIPVIAEKMKRSSLQNLDKSKYLIPKDMTVGQFQYVIRKRLKIKSEDSIYLFFGANATLVCGDELMSKIYAENKDLDGFLYIFYDSERTFGQL